MAPTELLRFRRQPSTLNCFPYHSPARRSEFKLRVGNYRVIYEFGLGQGRIYLHYVGNRRDILQANLTIDALLQICGLTSLTANDL